MIPRLLFIMALSVHLAAGAPTSTTAQPKVALWGARAVLLSTGSTARGAASPDGLKVPSVRDSHLSIRISGKPVNSDPTPILINNLAELLWSPSSNGFAITDSDGGLVGTWSVRLYVTTGGRLREVQVTDRVRSDFQTRTGGCRDEVPNVGAVGWLNPDRLLVVAEAPPHSSCRDMGTFRGYELSVPSGQPLRTFDAHALRTCCAALLGPRFNEGVR